MKPLVPSSVCAVVITYNPGEDLISNVQLLSPQVGHVVLVDNASVGAAAARISEIEEQSSCSVIRNGRNLGIAAALNIGFRFAIDRHYEWIVTFDQDSTVTDGFILALLGTADAASAPALISPTYFDRQLKMELGVPTLAGGEPLTAMTSGSMLHRSTFLKAGPFDERLFIDQVDIEYCLRIRSMGMHIMRSERAVLLHSLGNISFRRVFGKRLVATNHSPARRYYKTRNRLFLLFRYAHDWNWIRFDVRATLAELLAILLIERQKLSKIRYMIRGAFDFTRGKWGPQVPL
ncbi:MAG TPA: glycosyltransferase family 2 protein [Terriglobales bacterium]|nr:glycosyltransferase family 2 protein [Terriglobales bacterium]